MYSLTNYIYSVNYIGCACDDYTDKGKRWAGRSKGIVGLLRRSD